MKQLSEIKRVKRLIDEAIETFQLDLSGLSVLTEAGSGSFITTSLIAALANAEKVFAVTRSSQYGSFGDVINYGRKLASKFGVESKITFSKSEPQSFANQADIVTNLGFVRPMNRLFIEILPKHAVIALMWEPWEFRDTDIDMTACKNSGVLVMGTCETDNRLKTFDYVGILAAKLLLEAEIEILDSKIALIGSDPLESAVYNLLDSMGAKIIRLQLPESLEAGLDALYGNQIENTDALVVIEHRDHREIIGMNKGIHPKRLCVGNTQLIHVCGTVDEEGLKKYNVSKWPVRQVPHGVMTVTTDYVGPKPVIALHCAGLRVAETAVRVRIAGGDLNEAVSASEATGLGLKMGEIFG